MNLYKLSNRLLLFITIYSLFNYTPYTSSFNYIKKFLGLDNTQESSQELIDSKNSRDKKNTSIVNNNSDNKSIENTTLQSSLESKDANNNIILTSQDFKTKVLTKNKALIKFSAQWCGPCKTMQPIIEKLRQEYSGKLFIFDIDVDKLREVADQYDVQSIPNLVFLENGKEKGRIVGETSKKQIINKIKEYFNI